MNPVLDNTNDSAVYGKFLRRIAKGGATYSVYANSRPARTLTKIESASLSHRVVMSVVREENDEESSAELLAQSIAIVRSGGKAIMSLDSSDIVTELGFFGMKVEGFWTIEEHKEPEDPFKDLGGGSGSNPGPVDPFGQL